MILVMIMKMSLRCMPCFLKQVNREIEGSNLPLHKEEEMVRSSLFLLCEMSFDKAPVEVSLELHDLLLDMGADKDPYLELKRISNKKALGLLGEVRQFVNSSKGPLQGALLAACAGNVMDYGAANLLDMKDVLEDAREKGFSIDDTSKFLSRLEKAKELIYLLDNSGEAVFDRYLMKIIHERFPEMKIRAVVKSEPLLNDVTREDVEEIGIHEDEHVTIEEVPHRGWFLPEDVGGPSDDTIVLSKGQGNFESLSECTDVFFLFIVKCDVVSAFLNVELGGMVFKHGCG